MGQKATVMLLWSSDRELSDAVLSILDQDQGARLEFGGTLGEHGREMAVDGFGALIRKPKITVLGEMPASARNRIGYARMGCSSSCAKTAA